MNYRFDLFDMIYCISSTCDLISNEIADHHNQVAFLAVNIARELDFTVEQQRNIFIAGLLHDIGAFSTKERRELLLSEADDIHDHALIGASLLENFEPLKNVAEIIRYHHLPWGNGAGRLAGGRSVSPESHVIHLADRVAVQIDPKREIIGQADIIRENIRSLSGRLFVPEFVDAFLELSKREYLWFSVINKPLMSRLPDLMNFTAIGLSLDETVSISEIFANIIDFRSPFTARHSIGVAAVAEKLAELSGFTEKECKMMLIAGYLHDLGKLAIDNDILEKNGALSEEEYNIIKTHTFHTYRTLQVIKGFEVINNWASLHHEKLNGAGYPFHLKAGDIPPGSRIMAVADTFTALLEDRPYRRGIGLKNAVATIGEMVDSGLLCPAVFKTLMANLEELDAVRMAAQERAGNRYELIHAVLAEPLAAALSAPARGIQN
ncbi:HDIG domain-containing protein [Sporobacter termitidis DSM 10068]|uniref:HDIG domain-containing protein n=2 Tax=Sporobacter TaxID=44748 RepID=A0A1M5UJP2_9FIRM|nr:HDIG domain-containing protein [Sporobacter termitidis DSM 10068]